MKRVASVGEAMIELSMSDENARVGVAGDTLNTAIYLQRTAPQLTVDYITCLGSDTLSTRIFDFVGHNGLGNSLIKQIPDKTPGLYAINTNTDGERSFIYWRSNSAARDLFMDYDFSVLESFDVLYLSGISMAILPHKVRISFLEWLKRSPIELIFDSNYRPHLWDSIGHAQQITSALWVRADVSLPSIDDEMLLFNETEDQVCARFLATAKTGALKRGEQGPLSLCGKLKSDYKPAKKVVDTTAAGDSFNGGYIGALLSGKSQKEALMSGHKLASKVVQYHGAIIPK